jgi:NAD(P)-dependent dehydrogenase (short-subunit alcohol dehydrogenase family)
VTEKPLSRRVALITGAASGIGRATALELASMGADVAGIDIDADGLTETARMVQELGSRCLTISTDLATLETAEPIVQQAAAELRAVYILVNAAGIFGQEDFLTTTLDAFDRVFAVNLRAPFLLMQAVAARMVERGEGGRIVNVSSSSAFRALGVTPAYAGSKAALQALTRVAAADLGPHDINVNAVVPGLTRTSMAQHFVGGDDVLNRGARDGPLSNLLGRVSEPEDVAAVIAFLCLPQSRQITGQMIHTSAGTIV